MIALEELAQKIEPVYTYPNYPRRIRHQQRTMLISEMLARSLNLPDEEIEEIMLAARFCNNCERFWPEYMIDKVHTDFTIDDVKRIKTHPFESARFLENDLSVASNSYPKGALEIIRYHHETYTPSAYGYPGKKFGEDIPIGSRIILVAESYAAMRSSREHRSLWARTWPHSYAIDELIEKTFESKDEMRVRKDAEYCPTVVSALMQISKEELDKLFVNVS